MTPAHHPSIMVASCGHQREVGDVRVHYNATSSTVFYFIILFSLFQSTCLDVRFVAHNRTMHDVSELVPRRVVLSVTPAHSQQARGLQRTGGSQGRGGH